MQKFLIQLKKRIEGNYFSEFFSVFKGSGLEVDDIRKYVPGDSPKHIHRKMSAKHGRLFTKLFQAEKSVDVDIFLDLNYNFKGQVINNKGQIRNNFVLTMELLADIFVYVQKHLLPTKVYFPISKFFHSPKIEMGILKNDYSNSYILLDQINRVIKKSPRIYQSHLSNFLYIAKKNKKRRAIVIISDFLQLTESEKKLLKYFQKEHSLQLFRIQIDKDFGQNFLRKKDMEDMLQGLELFELL